MNDFLFNILAWIRSWVGSWGWSMVVFTIMVRLVLTPLDIIWSLGHTGDEGPQVAMTGEARGCSRAAAPVCGFSRGTTARSVSLSWGGKEVGSPCEWRGGARLYSQVIVGESGLETC